MRIRSGLGNVSLPRAGRTTTSRRAIGVAVAALTAAMLFIVGAIPAWAITVTFVRHGQSAGNASGFIDTSVPGPELTELGQQEAAAVAAQLSDDGYDAIYASNMIRTQQTAAPLADALNLDVNVLPGFREISAGIFEGSSEKEGLGRIAYGLGPMTWVLGLRSLPIPGSTDGNEFDARVDDALQTVYDSGAQKPVVFAHGATIMFWVMMNVDNPDPLLMLSHPLGNTAVVVVNGSPEEGWTLESWDGVEVPANPSLGTKVFVNVRDLVTAPQTSIYRVVKALETGNPVTIATAVRDATAEIVTAPVKFVGAMTRDVIEAVQGAFPAPQASTTPSAAAVQEKQSTTSTRTRTPEKAAPADADTTKVVTGDGSESAVTDAADTSELIDGGESRADKAASRDERRDLRVQEKLRDVRDRVKTSLHDAAGTKPSSTPEHGAGAISSDPAQSGAGSEPSEKAAA